MSENEQSKDLMNKLIEVDSKLEAINSLLASQAPLNGRSKTAPDLSDAKKLRETISGYRENLDNEESSSAWAESKNPLPRRVTVSASEVENIIQKVDKINRDEEILVRVERLEIQNRKITILGSLFVTFMLLVIAVFTVLMFQANLLNKGAGLIASPRDESLTPSPPQEKVAKVDEPHPPESVAKVTEPKPAEPMKPVSDATPPEAIPPVTYVGSITSNKYHYPHCKWAAQIHPHKLRNFSSVKEAHEQGYIPCPTCGPPNHDP